MGFTKPNSTWGTEAFNVDIGCNLRCGLEVNMGLDIAVLQGPNLKKILIIK